MNLNRVPPELTDGIFGDHESRRNLERSAELAKEIEFAIPDVTDCTDIIAELEKSWLLEEIAGLTADSVPKKKPNETRRTATVRRDDEVFDLRKSQTLHPRWRHSAPAMQAYKLALLDDVVSDSQLAALEKAAFATFRK